MATLDEQSGTAPDSTADGVAPRGRADGDDIVVVPDEPRAPGRRGWWAAIAVIAVLAVIVGVVIATRDDTTASVATATTPATTSKRPAAKKTAPKPAVKKKTTTPPSIAPVVPAPPKPVIGQPVTHGPSPVHAPSPVVAPPVSIQPVKTYPPSVLVWTAPPAITIKHGTTTTVVVRAMNPTNGTVTLPHALSCAPRLDHSEVCAEVAQIVAARSNVGARYTIDATNVKPGSYTLSIEGLRTIRVTVTP